MYKRVGFALIAMLFLPGMAMVESGSPRAIEVKTSKPQVNLLGEVKEKKIPNMFFYEKVNPIVDEKQLLAAGYLARTDNPFGAILDSDIDGKTIAAGDSITINRGSSDGVKSGDEFYIYRRSSKVKHPDTKEEFGYLITIMGSLKITDAKSQVSSGTITDSYRMLLKGDLIRPKFDIRVPAIDPDRPLEEKSINGTIVSVGTEKLTASERDIVYLNVGRGSNVNEGDVFAIYRDKEKGSTATSDFKDILGKLKIIMVRGDTSTAVVTHSSRRILTGDRATYLQER